MSKKATKQSRETARRKARQRVAYARFQAVVMESQRNVLLNFPAFVALPARAKEMIVTRLGK